MTKFDNSSKSWYSKMHIGRKMDSKLAEHTDGCKHRGMTTAMTTVTKDAVFDSFM